MKCVLEECSMSDKSNIKIWKDNQDTAKQCSTFWPAVRISLLYIYLYESHDGDLKEFFFHEIQSFSPSLSQFGKLIFPNTKSELLKCIQSPSTQPESPICYDCWIMDGTYIVHFLPATRNTTSIMNMQRMFLFLIFKCKCRAPWK